MNNITVNLPVHELLALLRAIDEHYNTTTELSRLKSEVAGLRNLYYESIQIVGELRKEIHSMRKAGA